jgi:inner membrane protein
VDNLTHSLFALTLANAGLRRAGRGTTAALVIASNIPDIEVFTAVTGGRLGYLAAHRGPTHGPLGLLLGVATGIAVWLALRLARDRRGAAPLASLVAVSCVGIVGHIAMDFATSYGTRVLSPFRPDWYGVDWMPIVDVVLWGILGAGIVVAALKPGYRARAAACALLLASGDYAARGLAHAKAMEAAMSLQASAGSTPSPSTVPPTIFRYFGEGEPAALPAALPTPWSPFDWRLILRTPGGFEVRTFDIRSGRTVGEVIAFPNDRTPVTERAATASTAQVFLAFSRFPAADAIPRHDGGTMVHWYDLRFAERPIEPGDGRPYTSPFAIWVHLDQAGRLVRSGLGPG